VTRRRPLFGLRWPRLKPTHNKEAHRRRRPSLARGDYYNMRNYVLTANNIKIFRSSAHPKTTEKKLSPLCVCWPNKSYAAEETVHSTVRASRNRVGFCEISTNSRLNHWLLPRSSIISRLERVTDGVCGLRLCSLRGFMWCALVNALIYVSTHLPNYPSEVLTLPNATRLVEGRTLPTRFRSFFNLLNAPERVRLT